MKFDNFKSLLYYRCLYLEDNKEACRSCNDFRKTLNQRIRREALRAKQMKNNSKKVSKENYCYLQHLPEVWERAREPYGKRRFSRRSQKSNFCRIATNFFLAVATVGRNMLIFFQIFAIKEKGSF